MADVAVVTKCMNSREFYSTNQTPTAYTTLANTLTLPTTGLISLNNSQVSPHSFADFTFWGQGTAGQVFNVQVVGWRVWSRPTGDEYEPIVLADLLCTLGAQTSAVTTADKMVSAITVNSSVVTANNEITPAPTNCPIQHIQLDLKGVQYVQLLRGTGNVTNFNGKMGGF